MDGLKYEFHKEAMPELVELVKAAQELKREAARENTANIILQKYIAKNEDLKALMKQFPSNNVNSTEAHIHVDLTDKNCSQKNFSTTLQNNSSENDEPIVQMNTTRVDDLIDTMKESLTYDKCVTGTILEQIGNLCSQEQMTDLMTSLSSCVDDEGTFGLGEAICSLDSQNLTMAKCYFECILLPTVNTTGSPHLQKAFILFYKKYSTIIKSISELTNNTLLEPNTRGTFLQNVCKLDATDKDVIIRNMLDANEELTEQQIKVLDSLLEQGSEINIITKVVQLMADRVNDFISNKVFGKLLVTVLQVLGKNVNKIEQPLRIILARHNSLWKSKAQTLFDTNFECFHLSQSLIKH